MEYVDNMVSKCGPLHTGGEKMNCIMNLDCKNEFAMYLRCHIQYQKSTFLCKVPKLDMYDCYQKQIKSINLIINKFD